MKARHWVLYPLLIGPYPAIALYAQNAQMDALWSSSGGRSHSRRRRRLWFGWCFF